MGISKNIKGHWNKRGVNEWDLHSKTLLFFTTRGVVPLNLDFLLEHGPFPPWTWSLSSLNMVHFDEHGPFSEAQAPNLKYLMRSPRKKNRFIERGFKWDFDEHGSFPEAQVSNVLGVCVCVCVCMCQLVVRTRMCVCVCVCVCVYTHTHTHTHTHR